MYKIIIYFSTANAKLVDEANSTIKIRAICTDTRQAEC